MGWCSATDIIDSAIEGAERALAEAWQIASGNEGAKTPVLANALNADRTLRARLDDVLRPFVANIAEQLRRDDWDCIDESEYFDRFPQEMLGLDDQAFDTWLVEKLHEHDPFTPEYSDLSFKLEALRKRKAQS